MLLVRLDPRASLAVRLVALALVAWSVIGAPHHAASLHGRGLAVSGLLAVSLLAGLGWLRSHDLDAPLRPDVHLLGFAGGGLLGACPDSAAAAFVFVAVVNAALRVELVRAMRVVALGALALGVGVLVWDGDATGLLAYALGFAAAALAASNVRQFRARADQAELLLAQSERSLQERMRAARLEESARIAREIHDVLAHSLAGLTIQLEATTALVDGGADRAQVLARVRHAHALARDGLRETRRAVGALRGEPVEVPAALETLAAEYRSAEDRPAALVIDGDRARLAGDPGVAVLRVVQEALTNVAKHAPGAEATVAVVVAVDAGGGSASIRATVENRAAAVAVATGSLAASGGGFGLRGMRERAVALGGTVSAGPTGDGWRVELVVPAAADAPAPRIDRAGPP